MGFYSIAHFVNTYRLHVVAVFLILCFLNTRPYVRPELLTEYYAALIAFGFLWLGFYIGNKYFDFVEDSVSQPLEARTGMTIGYLTILLYVFPIPLLFWYELPVLPYLTLVLLTLAYSAPLPGTTLRIKKFLFIKNIYAALMWWGGIAFLLHFYTTQYFTLNQAFLATISIFVFIFIIELLWDIRDVDGDRSAGNTTVPVYFGIQPTKWFIGFLLLTIFALFPNPNLLVLVSILYLLFVTIFAQTGFRASYFHAIIYVQIIILSAQILII